MRFSSANLGLIHRKNSSYYEIVLARIAVKLSSFWTGFCCIAFSF